MHTAKVLNITLHSKMLLLHNFKRVNIQQKLCYLQKLVLKLHKFTYIPDSIKMVHAV